MSHRLPVPRTALLLLNGKLVPSESARTYELTLPDGSFAGNVCQASRKDVRDAVRYARSGQKSWSGLPAASRTRSLYRVAELLETRAATLSEEVALAEGMSADDALGEVHAAVDRVVWFAGWCDKIMQVLSCANPVPGLHASVSSPVPAGVAAVVAPPQSSLVGFVDAVFPALASGCSVVALASEDRPFPAVTVAEAITAADLPAGAVNVLTGVASELVPTLASHADINVLDLWGVDDPALAREAEALAAHTLTRVLPPDHRVQRQGRSSRTLRGFVETRTVWTSVGK